jgi:hypothetical protein
VGIYSRWEQQVLFLGRKMSKNIFLTRFFGFDRKEVELETFKNNGFMPFIGKKD